MARLSIALGEPFQEILDGKPVTGFESNKVKAMLVFLTVDADRPHPRETLAGLLWPDYPDRSALNNLRSALTNLRQVIGDRQAEPPFLLITRNTLQFNTASDYALDISAFQNLVEQPIDQLEQETNHQNRTDYAGRKITGVEYIGYDEMSGHLKTHVFDSVGPDPLEYTWEIGEDTFRN